MRSSPGPTGGGPVVSAPRSVSPGIGPGSELVKLIIKRGGCALMIDYGHTETAPPGHRLTRGLSRWSGVRAGGRGWPQPHCPCCGGCRTLLPARRVGATTTFCGLQSEVVPELLQVRDASRSAGRSWSAEPACRAQLAIRLGLALVAAAVLNCSLRSRGSRSKPPSSSHLMKPQLPHCPTLLARAASPSAPADRRRAIRRLNCSLPSIAPLRSRDARRNPTPSSPPVKRDPGNRHMRCTLTVGSCSRRKRASESREPESVRARFSPEARRRLPQRTESRTFPTRSAKTFDSEHRSPMTHQRLRVLVGSLAPGVLPSTQPGRLPAGNDHARPRPGASRVTLD